MPARNTAIGIEGACADVTHCGPYGTIGRGFRSSPREHNRFEPEGAAVAGALARARVRADLR